MTSSMSRDLADRKSSINRAAPTAAAAGSEPSGASSPRRRFPRISASPRCPATIPEHPDEDAELWVDGPRSSICIAPAAESLTTHTLASSSGPKFSSQSAGAPDTAELWVDGPVEFRTRLPNPRSVGNEGPAAVARKPVITNNDAPDQTVTASSRQSRRSATSHCADDDLSKSRLPRTGASKYHHSSPRPRHSAQPSGLDGRITEWVKSVQQANRLPDTDLSRTDVSEPQELQETTTAVEDHEERRNGEVEQDKEEMGSESHSSRSLYEHQLDESLETASLCGCVLTSSDEDTAAAVNCQVDRLRDDVADDCADNPTHDKLPSAAAKENIPSSNNSEDVSETGVRSSPCERSRPVEPFARSASNCSRHGSGLPVSQRSSSPPRGGPSSPCRNSSAYECQSPRQPPRLNPTSTSKTSTPGSVRRCGDKVPRERSSGAKKSAEHDRIQTGVSLPKFQKASKPQQQLKLGGGGGGVGSQNVEIRSAKSSPRSARADRRSSILPTVVKRTPGEAGDDVGGGGGGHGLQSPYRTVTSPRRPGAGCSTSSDNSSLLSDAVTSRSKSSEVELSSGYESMMRDDSEETITAQCADWMTADAEHTDGE